MRTCMRGSVGWVQRRPVVSSFSVEPLVTRLTRFNFSGAGRRQDCPSSDNLGQLSVLSFGGSGSYLIEVMRFHFGGASAA